MYSHSEYLSILLNVYFGMDYYRIRISKTFCSVKQIHPFLVQIVLLPSFVSVLKISPKQSLPSKLQHLCS